LPPAATRIHRDQHRATCWNTRALFALSATSAGLRPLTPAALALCALWGIPTFFCYAPRRVECAQHGVVVEHIPWSEGKRPLTCAMMGFLARWARRLSWRDTARAFQTSWEAVYRSVDWFVQYGLAHRQRRGVEAIGVDEIHWGHGLRADNFLTVIYQIDRHCRRLLWVGPRRSQATLRRGLKALGPELVKGLRFVCSDMWKPYLQVNGEEPIMRRKTPLSNKEGFNGAICSS
jgi:transposase